MVALITILDVALDLIQVQESARPLDQEYAHALGRLMASEGGEGQNFDPIWVTTRSTEPGYVLVAGLHRLEGARFVGWPTIRAEVLTAEAAERWHETFTRNPSRIAYDDLVRPALVATVQAKYGEGDAVNFLGRTVTGDELACIIQRGKTRFDLPRFWPDVPVRNYAVELHRKMTVSKAASAMLEHFGDDRAPSRSGLARFWLALDNAKGRR